MRNTPVQLNENLLIGRGGHKDVYAHPENFSRCIKIVRDINDPDWERELHYRRSRMRRGLTSNLLPAYYGTVETNLGTGHVFERVFDYDGSPTLSFDAALEKAVKEIDNIEILRGLIENGLVNFYLRMREEEIITTNMEPKNFLVQHIAPEAYRMRIVDNIGSPVKLPFLFYIDYFARKHIDRYWQRFMDFLQQEYPHLITDDMKRRLTEK